MRSAKVCLLVAAVGLTLAAAMAPAAGAAPKPQFFHVSAYGVQRQNIVETWVPAPCEPGGRGGGYEGVLTVNSRITWETLRPGKAQFARFGSVGFFNALPGKKGEFGLQTRVKISRKVTNNVQFIHCSMEGLPLPSPDPRHIGTNCPTTDARGFAFFYTWDNGKLKTIFSAEPGEKASLNQDYQDCYGNKVANDGIHVEVPLPLSDLSNRGLGKITTTRRFSKEGPGVAEGSLTMTNTIAGKTYVNLKRLKQE
jgi:hypothetical protein